MNTTGIAYITVGGNRYAIEKLAPLEAVTWGNRVFALIAPALGDLFDDSVSRSAGFRAVFSAYDSEAVSRLMTDALRHCYTPGNEPLSNEAVFNTWFRAHPGDLYELGLLAVWELARDFLPSRFASMANLFQGQMQSMAGTVFPSQAGGKQEPSPDA